MKREEVRAIFPDATDEQIDSILNKARDEINPLKSRLKDAESERDEAKSALSESQQSEASYKQKLEEATAKLQEGMSAEELLAQREAAAEEREREFALKSSQLDAKEIFVGAGCFEESEITELVEQVASGDAEATKARAQRIVDTVMRQREAVEAATKDAMLKENPKPNGAGGKGTPATVKEFLELPYSEQLALKEANPSILSELTKG